MGEQPQAARARLRAILRPWPIYLIAIAVVTGGVWFSKRQRASGVADPVLPAAVTLKQDIEVQFQDVIMQGRQRGVQRWVINAPKVALSKDGRYTYFEPNPKGRFLNLKDWSAKEEATASRVRSLDWTAKHATFDSYTEDLEIVGSTVVTTDEKDVIRTEQIEYKSREKLVRMPHPVDIKLKDGTTITAGSLTANTEAEVLELKEKVVLDAPLTGKEKL